MRDREPSSPSGAGAALLAGLVAGLVAGCSAEAPPVTFALTDGHLTTERVPPPLRVEDDGGAIWIDHVLAGTAWKTTEAAGIWSTPRPDSASVMSGEGLDLRAPGTRFTHDDTIDSAAHLRRLAPGSFAVVESRLYLCLAPEGRPPDSATFSVRKARSRDGHPALGGFTGEGFSLWPGERLSFRVRVRSGSALRFYFGAEGLIRKAESRASLVVTPDGGQRVAFDCAADSGGVGRWCEMPLVASQSGSDVTFELAGEPVLAVVLAPRVGPAEPPPRSEQAPNLVLFLADTLRHDALELGGGPPDLAPAINALAREGLGFPAARAPATWTLPSQVSMLTGLHPEQHGAVSDEHGLGADAVTLPEVLRAQGWRTGAVTDSAFVSRQYGFEQGFEWFVEFRRWNLGVTLAAAKEFLAADDGRPTFLFVQTYRTHMPYRTGPDEDRSALRSLVRELRDRAGGAEVDAPELQAEAGARFRALYEQGVRALDAGFGAWWPDVRALAPTFLIFTSDHGEAFFENGQLGHGGFPWETRTRIPLFVHGPGVPARRVPYSASLVDVPLTLCALGRAAPHESFGGHSLLDLAEERSSYAFVRLPEQSLVAVVDGTRKLVAAADPARLAAGELLSGTDLALDPGEKDNLAVSQGWGAELARAQTAVIEVLLRPLASARRVELSGEDRAFLDDIGYGGD